jgi:hypothetical protein
LLEFNQLIEPFRHAIHNIAEENETDATIGDAVDDDQPITAEQLHALAPKTNRHLRTAELIRQLSAAASLIVLFVDYVSKYGSNFSANCSTMPIQRSVKLCTPPVYMAWLEMLSGNHDQPVLFVRGNQTNVLTLYA